MIVLDAGVVIAFLDRRDAHHDRAIAILEEHAPPYLMHPLTLAEVLVGPAASAREDAVLADLRSIGVEAADLGPDESVLLARTRARVRLKMPDTCVLATASHHGVPLATFDAQLARAAGDAGLLVR